MDARSHETSRWPVSKHDELQFLFFEDQELVLDANRARLRARTEPPFGKVDGLDRTQNTLDEDDNASNSSWKSCMSCVCGDYKQLKSLISQSKA